MATFCPLKLLGLIFVTLIVTFSWKLLKKTLFKLSMFSDTWQFTSFSACTTSAKYHSPARKQQKRGNVFIFFLVKSIVESIDPRAGCCDRCSAQLSGGCHNTQRHTYSMDLYVLQNALLCTQTPHTKEHEKATQQSEQTP